MASSPTTIPRKRQSTNLFRITMNRFLTKKKAKDGYTVNADAYDALSSPPLSSPPPAPKSAGSRWRKGKKAPVEVKPELNLAAVLPSSDDFRTSLIMPNLSQRFSMLREQDDPNSKLGKASDDSVLQPRRQSRLMDFGFTASNLGDIAEVASIKSSIRPPFASNSRQESYGSEDGYGTDGESPGSVMTRARPGEGNVMFGGRQKIYKIAMSGASSSRALYEDDVNMSAFQRYRQQEREREPPSERPSEDFDFGLDQTQGGDQDETSQHTQNDSAKDLSHSPSLSSYEKKRLTTSSTAHSEARSSTAATSIASQPPMAAPAPVVQPPMPAAPPLKRSDTKTRRLYEQGLDQHIYDQQTSALTRLNSIQRQRTVNGGKQSPPYLQHTKSVNNLHNRTPDPVYALRTQSPPPLGALKTFGSMRQPKSSGSSPIIAHPQSPLSPPLSDLEETGVLSLALNPNDRGKATAMGAFNKPAQAFDEQQYVQRQQALQRSNSTAVVKKESPGASAVVQRLGRFEENRQQSNSRGSSAQRSRSRSVPTKHEPAKAFSVFQNAANQMRSAQPESQAPVMPDTHRTFFGTISASDSEEEEDIPEDPEKYGQDYGDDYPFPSNGGRWQPTPLPSVSEHPALRSQSSKFSSREQDENEVRPLRPMASSRSLRPEPPAMPGATDGTRDVDSPTLGPGNEPLSGLVSHLRNQSNQSSIYPAEVDEVPEVPKVPVPSRYPSAREHVARSTIGSESRVDSTYTNSNPWDLDDYYGDTASRSSVSPIDPARFRPQPFPSAQSRSNPTHDRSSAVSHDSDGTNGGTWQTELRKNHNRDASTATQQERDAFANELATRQKAIQENLRSIVESESRGTSPAPSSNGAFRAFGMLRSKSSRESVHAQREPSAKAMKMLGIASASLNASNVSVSTQNDRYDGGRPRNDSGSRPPPMPSARLLQQSDQDLRREWEQSRQRGDSEASTRELQSQQQQPQQPKTRTPPASTMATRAGRSRSNSEATSGRSRSRTGPYRDDLEKAMIEGTGSSAAGHPDLSPMLPQQLTPRASPEISQYQTPQFDSQGRIRSNSKPGTGYFDAKALHPIQTAPNGRLAPASTGPSPVTLSANVYSPVGPSPRPSPIAAPFSQNATPPLSGANTPAGAGFPSSAASQSASGRPSGPLLRKKTISKSDISEPTLISSTSNVDTVDLPEGASLKNGMNEVPPVPAINPRRRRTQKLFSAFSRNDSADDVRDTMRSPDYMRSKTPDPWTSRGPEETYPVKAQRSLRSPSDGRTPRMRLSPQRSYEPSPAIHQNGFGNISAGSPERVGRSPVPIEGGMF